MFTPAPVHNDQSKPMDHDYSWLDGSKPCLHIMVVEAHDLAIKDVSTRSSDPYCMLEIGGFKLRSAIMWQTLQPRWLQKFCMPFSHADMTSPINELRVNLWDHDFVPPDDFLGMCRIPMHIFADNATHDQWFELFPRDGKEKRDKVSGAVRLKFRVVDMPPYSAHKRGRGEICVEANLAVSPRIEQDWWDSMQGELAPALKGDVKWKQRNCILQNCFLFVYGDDMTRPVDVLCLWESKVEVAEKARKHAFALITYTGHSYLMAAADAETARSFLVAIRQAKDFHCASIGCDIGSLNNLEMHHQQEWEEKQHLFISTFSEYHVNEDLLEDFVCVLDRTVRWHGRLYVSPHYVFFSSDSFGHCSVVIPMSEIMKINKDPTTFSNTIKITTTTEEMVFTSFCAPTQAFQVLLGTCDLYMEELGMHHKSKKEIAGGDHAMSNEFTDMTPNVIDENYVNAARRSSARHVTNAKQTVELQDRIAQHVGGESGSADGHKLNIIQPKHKQTAYEARKEKVKASGGPSNVEEGQVRAVPSKPTQPKDVSRRGGRHGSVLEAAHHRYVGVKERDGTIRNGVESHADGARKSISLHSPGHLKSSSRQLLEINGSEAHLGGIDENRAKPASHGCFQQLLTEDGSGSGGQNKRRLTRIANTMNIPELSLGDFNVGAELGKGSFGKVEICMFRETGAEFAIKSVLKGNSGIDKVLHEKEVLSNMWHPMVVRCYGMFESSKMMYILFEYVPGGELFGLLKNGALKEKHAKFYAAETTLCFQYFHNHCIAYRDLKPENLLVDATGHLKFIDFGFAKEVEHRTWTLCGTPEYLAPEVIRGAGHGKGVDWWGLGVFIYEMLVGHTPFIEKDELNMYKRIVAGDVRYPSHLSKKARHLIQKLLMIDPQERYGCLRNGAEDIKRHKWFKKLDWSEVFYKRLDPPWIPQRSEAGDTCKH